jgi:hypothetical protein
MASVPSRSWMASAARARRGEGKLETMTLIVEEREGRTDDRCSTNPREERVAVTDIPGLTPRAAPAPAASAPTRQQALRPLRMISTQSFLLHVLCDIHNGSKIHGLHQGK